MPQKRADVVICGAGIAGISAAFHLIRQGAVPKILLVDSRPPLTLTSDKSTECYRNWWPGPGDAMVGLMNRSIDLLETMAEASGNVFHMNRRGYLFATANPNRVPDFIHQAEEAARFGAGPLRIHDGRKQGSPYRPLQEQGYEDQPDGADLILDPQLIREHFHYLARDTVAVIHPRRCGWFSAQQLGTYMLQEARASGVELIEGQVEQVKLEAGCVAEVRLSTPSGGMAVSTPNFVNAAGPYLGDVARHFGVDLPLYTELHAKISIHDHLGLFPRDAPLLIWADEQKLNWRHDERQAIAEAGDLGYLLETFPQGVHARPEGPDDSPIVLILWTYDMKPVPPRFPIQTDPNYPEIALRGLARMIPALQTYFDQPPRPYIDGGYYTKTRENRPLIGPLPVEGAWVIGALSGYGLMAGPASGELLAMHLCGNMLPDYSTWFLLERYQDPSYRVLLENWGETGQL
ncbi:MAG: NAD(P)/FAD-dependent oxidoreductase [Anaerolineales bacterium]